MDKNRSMVDVAYELMSKKKKAVNFYKLWQEVSEVKGFDEEEKDDIEEELLFGNGYDVDEEDDDDEDGYDDDEELTIKPKKK